MVTYSLRDLKYQIEDDYHSRMNVLRMCPYIFDNDDLFLTVRLSGIDNQKNWVLSKFSSIDRLVNNKRTLKYEGGRKEIKHISVLVNDVDDNHPHAHIMIKNIEYKSDFAPDFKRLIEYQFKKDRTRVNDVFIRPMQTDDYAYFYTLMKQKNSSIV